jgi:hypothetical protein
VYRVLANLEGLPQPDNRASMAITTPGVRPKNAPKTAQGWGKTDIRTQAARKEPAPETDLRNLRRYTHKKRRGPRLPGADHLCDMGLQVLSYHGG